MEDSSQSHESNPESAAAASADDDHDWSQLPNDLLGQMALKTNLFEDFTFFSNVCRSWRHAASTVRKDWHPRYNQMPWIMTMESVFDSTASFYNPNKGTSFTLSLPDSKRTTFWGSSYNWITMVDGNCNFYLYNPLSQIQLSFPNLQTLPYFFTGCWGYSMIETRLFVLKVSEYEHLVVALYIMNCLWFAAPGDEDWITVELGHKAVFVADATYWNGMLLIMYNNGAVEYADIMNRGGSRVINAGYYVGESITMRFYDKLYMVESFGSLLMVHRHIKQADHDASGNKHNSMKTTKFEVYMLDLPTKTWKSLNHLGDVALFMSEEGSMSVSCASADKLSDNCKPNHIYFNDDYCEFNSVYFNDEKSCTSMRRVIYSMGLYNMEDNTIRSFDGMDCSNDVLKFYPSWFMPTMQ